MNNSNEKKMTERRVHTDIYINHFIKTYKFINLLIIGINLIKIWLLII